MDPGLVVSNSQKSNGRADPTVFSYGHIPLRELESADLQGYQSVVELLQAVGGGIIRKFVDKDWSDSGVYIQNVITYADNRERNVLHKYLIEQGTLFGRDLFGFSFDDDHVHVLHSCAFSSNQCKCQWRKKIPCGVIRPGYKFRSRLREWGRNNFISAILYFFFQKGGAKEAWIEGRRQRLEDNLKRVQWSEVEEKLGEILGLSNTQTGLDIQPGDSDGEFSKPIAKRRKRGYEQQEGSQENKRYRLSKWQIISGKISKLLGKTAICPLEGIKNEDCFLNDDMLTDPDNSTRVNKAIEIWSQKINSSSLKELYQMYEKGKQLNQQLPDTISLFSRAMITLENNFDDDDLNTIKTMWSIPERQEIQTTDFIFSKSKVYYPLDESTEILDDLLHFQFDDDIDRITRFLQDLVNVMDWQPEENPHSNIKCNTFLVYSEPSAGKNFFFDTLFTLCLNLGQLGTANKSNNFAFQDAANRRVILWNEPNYESSCTDYLKTLFEGGDTKVRVKMLGDTHIKRTPIIILTNNYVNFMSDIAFTDRIVQYKWKAAPMLKNLKLKPYPLSFFELLIKYNIGF